MHEGIFDFIDCHLQCLVVAHFFRDFFAGMDDCGMIPAAKGLANARQGKIGHLPAQIHGVLPGQGDLLIAALG